MNHEQEIVKQYKAGRYIVDLCKEFNCSKHELYKILDANNVKRKHSRLCTCNTCKHIIKSGSFKFCPHCGAKVKTDLEIAIENVTKLMGAGGDRPYSLALLQQIMAVLTSKSR